MAALMTTGTISFDAMLELLQVDGHFNWNQWWLDAIAPQPHEPDASEVDVAVISSDGI